MTQPGGQGEALDQSLKESANAVRLRADFAGVETWIFDLDNTLYPARHRLFDQIDARMTAFIAKTLSLHPDEANTLRAEYWRRHGTTLNGLMREHGMGPKAFLDFVHDIDLSHMPAATDLADAINALPGRKIVHTNGSRGHAERVTDQLQIAHCFEALYGIEDSALIPKPEREAYERVASLADFDPARAAMFEDTARNLVEPHRMGMRTIWTPTNCAMASDGAEGAHVHHAAPELTCFIQRLAAALAAP